MISWRAVAFISLIGCVGDEPSTGVVAEAVNESGEGGGPPVARSCDGSEFPTSMPNPVQCCRWGNHTYHVTTRGILGHRTLGLPCREADGVGTNCVGRECVYGPCGARINWGVAAAELHVFHPTSKPDRCGWSAVGISACTAGCDWPEDAERSFPEPYGDHVPATDDYPGVIATCPYTDCIGGGERI